jgi:hypothetical protein
MMVLALLHALLVTQPPAEVPSFAALTVTLDWPAADAPTAMRSAHVEVTDVRTRRPVLSAVVTPATGPLHVPSLKPARPYEVVVVAHRSLDATGGPLGAGAACLRLVPGEARDVPFRLGGDVASLTVSPDPAEVPVTTARELHVSARDSAGNLLLPRRRWEWSCRDSGTATVDRFGTVKGLAEGFSSVTVRDPVSGVSGAGEVIVTWHTVPKLLVLIHDPILEARGGKRLSEVMGYSDPDRLTENIIADLRAASGGQVEYTVAKRIEVDGYPVKADGFVYDDDSYLSGKWHQPDGVDYRRLIADYDILGLVERGEIDEVWLFGAPYFGYWESLMVGADAHWCNSTPITDLGNERRFVIMGYNYERGVGEALEDHGHRAESTLSEVFGSWEPEPKHAWDRFTLHEKDVPGLSACGNVHYAPTSASDYDWGNPGPVLSTCDGWYDPRTVAEAKPRWVTADEWGAGDIRERHCWWFDHFPRLPGAADGLEADWWKYLVGINEFKRPR